MQTKYMMQIIVITFLYDVSYFNIRTNIRDASSYKRKYMMMFMCSMDTEVMTIFTISKLYIYLFTEQIKSSYFHYIILYYTCK